MKQLSITEVNQMRQPDFVGAFAEVFERSAWIAEAAYQARPFESWQDLHQTMVAVVAQAPEEQLLALIRAHPDLAGKAARSGTLTSASRSEQSGAGLDHLSEAEYQYFHQLNDSYQRRFNIPFILAVKGHDKDSILKAFEERLHHDQQSELATALGQIEKIAWFRLAAMFEA